MTDDRWVFFLFFLFFLDDITLFQVFWRLHIQVTKSIVINLKGMTQL